MLEAKDLDKSSTKELQELLSMMDLILHSKEIGRRTSQRCEEAITTIHEVLRWR